jgi:AcrR family transcriptional regulator
MEAKVVTGEGTMERLTAESYFNEALALLGQQGSQALTIAALCERLDVTKGSFYHHFGGMPAFVDELLAYWEREHSDRLIALSQAQTDTSLRITSLTELAVNLPHASESAIRAWGRSSPDVAAVVERVDEHRERHVVESLQALGLPPDRARILGRLAMDLLIGIQTREVPPSPDRARELLQEIERLVFVEADPELVAQLRERAGR